MSQAKDYFHFIEKLENDPKFCFMVINTGSTFSNKRIPNSKEYPDHQERKIDKFLEDLSFNYHVLKGTTEEVRKKFNITDENHPTYKQCVETISKHSTWSLMYAFFTAERFELGERAIAKNSTNSLQYAHCVIKQRFELGEKAISEIAEDSINYSRLVLGNKRFELAESNISTSSFDSLNYAKIIGRFELGEPAIARSGDASYRYANEVLRGRFELGEDAMMEDERIMLNYAQNVLKGKLPEKMHNAMVLKTYENEAA
jgi:hypothetical protein